MNPSNSTGLELNSSHGLFLLIVPVYLIFFIVFRKRKLSSFYDIVFILFCIYLVKLFCVTFLPVPLNYAEIEKWRVIRKTWPIFNIIPFKELYDVLSHAYNSGILFATKQALIQIGGNILMFAPFGFLLPILKRKSNNIINMLKISTIVSLLIEIVQLCVSFAIGVCFRYADIDDIITNVLGAVTGLLLFRLFLKVIQKLFHFDFYTMFTKN